MTYKLVLSLLSPVFFSVLFFPSVATENERLKCEQTFEGRSHLFDAEPPHPLPPPPLLPPQHKAIRDVGLRQNLTPLPFYHLTPISLESLQERELIPKCTKKCVENIYIYETQNKKRKILR